jgi:predicted AlkP superfamily phosphohydrolase/phosphomutase
VRSSATYGVGKDGDDVVDVLPDYCFAYALVNQGFVSLVDRTAAAVTARTMWDVLAQYGIASGVSNWPLTYPARASRGYVVSDRFDEAGSARLRLADDAAADPTTAADVAREVFDRWQDRDWRDALPSSDSGEAEPAGLIRARWDRAYVDTAAELEQQFAPRLTVVRLEGLDALAHNYFHTAMPELFGDPRRTDPARSIVDRYYDYLDEQVGRFARALAPGDLLLVVSGFGMEPTPLSKRVLARVTETEDFTGTHEPAPDGFLLASGSHVATGQWPRGSVVDLAPTVLYYLGIDIGRDMDGYARTDLFEAPFVIEHPVRYVASHETSSH